MASMVSKKSEGKKLLTSGIKVYLIIWDKILNAIVQESLKLIGIDNHECIEIDTRIVSASFLDNLAKSDILIVEAYNHTKPFRDAEGFRLARIIFTSSLQVKPLVIFRMLDKKLLAHPCFIDYETFHEIDVRISRLLSSDLKHPNPFSQAVEYIPELDIIPDLSHIKV